MNIISQRGDAVQENQETELKGVSALRLTLGVGSGGFPLFRHCLLSIKYKENSSFKILFEIFFEVLNL